LPIKEIEFVVKNLPTQRQKAYIASLDSSTKYYHEIVLILHKYFHKTENNEILPNTSYEATKVLLSQVEKHYKKLKNIFLINIMQNLKQKFNNPNPLCHCVLSFFLDLDC
jgi:hypothetical protein